jgi:hypothetical protein
MNSPSEELVKMYDRNDVPFYVLTTDPEQKDDVLTMCDCAGQDGRRRGVRAHRGIVREYAAESAFGRFIIYHKYADPLRVRHSMSTMSSYGCRTRSV